MQIERGAGRYPGETGAKSGINVERAADTPRGEMNERRKAFFAHLPEKIRSEELSIVEKALNEFNKTAEEKGMYLSPEEPIKMDYPSLKFVDVGGKVYRIICHEDSETGRVRMEMSSAQ